MTRRRGLFAILTGGMVLLVAGTASREAWPQSSKDISSNLALSSPRFSDEIQLSSGSGEHRLPAVAYNHREGEYLIVWHYPLSSSYRQVLARRLSRSGQLLDTPAGLNNTGSNCYQAAVAYNHTNNEYLVVWVQDPDGSGTKNEIWGRICQMRPDYNGCVNVDFLIAKWSNRSFWTPRVAWNSQRNEYLVIWNALDSTTGQATDVAGYRLTAAGSVINDGFPIIITDTAYPHQADVAYNPAVDEYLVVWRHMFSPGDGDIYGRRLRGDGTFAGNDFSIYAPTSDQRFPAVATNQTDRYLVVWQHGTSSPSFNWDIYGQEIDSSGNPLGSVQALAYTADNEMVPDVAAKSGTGRDFMVTWERATQAGVTIQADRWTNEHTVFDVAAAIFWDNEKPTIAVGAPGYLFTYEGLSLVDPQPSRQIYGVLWWPAVINLPLILR